MFAGVCHFFISMNVEYLWYLINNNYLCLVLYYYYYFYCIVPPETVLILDEKGDHIPHYILGPYNEGGSIDLTCVSTGGK